MDYFIFKKNSYPQRYGYEGEQENDQALIYLDIDADLRPLFNWNSKQLFVYIYVEYITPKNVFFPKI